MFKSIDPRSPTPLYAQIADRIRLAVAAGELVKGESLPSVRALATQLRVNPATIVQAYRELERDRILEMRQGSGTFVADVPTETRAKEKSVAVPSPNCAFCHCPIASRTAPTLLVLVIPIGPPCLP